MTFPTISMRELETDLDEGRDMILVDLRNRPSYQKCHIQGAINIPYPDLERQAGCLPKGRRIVFYCSRGGQSLLACRQLCQMGYQVVNTSGGIAFYQGKYMVRP